MKNSLLFSLALLLLILVASPLTGAWHDVYCDSGGGSYAANSTYEANLRSLAAVLPAEVSASHAPYVNRAIGYWPNRPQAVASCLSGDGDCAACIADAFKQVEVQCPFRREASFFSSGNCSVRFGEFSIFGGYGGGLLVVGMTFQAIGLGCLFLMFLLAWRHDRTKKGTVM